MAKCDADRVPEDCPRLETLYFPVSMRYQMAFTDAEGDQHCYTYPTKDIVDAISKDILHLMQLRDLTRKTTPETYKTAYSKGGVVMKEEEIALKENEYDIISNPSHYTEGRKIEPLSVISDWSLGFCDGQVLKYISRAGRKAYPGKTPEESRVIDLEKALFYLTRALEEAKKA